MDDTVDVCRANPNNSIQCSRLLAEIQGVDAPSEEADGKSCTEQHQLSFYVTIRYLTIVTCHVVTIYGKSTVGEDHVGSGFDCRLDHSESLIRFSEVS